MKVSQYLITLAMAALPNLTWAQTLNTDANTLQIQHIRNATVKISYGDTVFLVDPMLAPKGTYPGFENTYRSELRNPMVELPIPVEEVLADVDAVIVTHTHLDHWDEVAQQLISKETPLFVQNHFDAQIIRDQGFSDVRILEGIDEFEGVKLIKTSGQHGSDYLYSIEPIATLLGEVMGVVFKTADQPVTYLVGDTIWNSDVQEAIELHSPDVIILNTGEAKLDGFDNDPILMGTEDTLKTHQAAPDAKIISVHMDAVNHMTMDRLLMSDYVQLHGFSDHVLIPEDGEIMSFNLTK